MAGRSVALAAAAVAAGAALGPALPAVAGLSDSSTAGSGRLASASLATRWVPVAGPGGVSGTGYQAGVLLGLIGSGDSVVDLVNDSTTSAKLSVTARSAAVVGVTNRLYRCPTAYSGSSCSGEQLLGAVPSAATTLVLGDVAAGTVVHLRVDVALSVGNSVALDAAAAWPSSPAGTDKTWR